MAGDTNSFIPEMKNLKYKRIIWQVELLNLLLICFEFLLLHKTDLQAELLPGLIIQITVYSLLSLIYYFVLSPTVLLKKTRTVVSVKTRNISEIESLQFIKRGILFFNSTKLIVLFMITSIMIINIYSRNSYYAFISMIFLLCMMLYFIILFTRNIAAAQGYVLTNNKELFQNFVIYYNPEDKRTTVDKPLGMGSTINLATKDGKMILGVILAIPLSIVIFLLIALALAGKI